METERHNRKNTNRVIQQRGDGAVGVHVEDNRPKGSRNFLSGAPLQRVIQREGEAFGKFFYVTDKEMFMHRSRIPFKPGRIYFMKYDGGPALSSDFTGCFIMAFHFNLTDEHLGRLRHPESPAFPYKSGPFIAHVSLDETNAVFDAENRGLITIDALYRPYRNGAIESKHLPTVPAGVSGKAGFTAGLQQGSEGWEGAVYHQERVTPRDGPLTPGDYVAGRFVWKIHELRRWAAEDMRMQTQASRAFIYGRAMLDPRLSPNQRHIAERALLAIDVNSIRLAFYTLLNPYNAIDSAVMDWMVHRFRFADYRIDL